MGQEDRREERADAEHEVCMSEAVVVVGMRGWWAVEEEVTVD